MFRTSRLPKRAGAERDAMALSTKHANPENVGEYGCRYPVKEAPSPVSPLVELPLTLALPPPRQNLVAYRTGLYTSRSPLRAALLLVVTFLVTPTATCSRRSAYPSKHPLSWLPKTNAQNHTLGRRKSFFRRMRHK